MSQYFDRKTVKKVAILLAILIASVIPVMIFAVSLIYNASPHTGGEENRQNTAQEVTEEMKRLLNEKVQNNILMTFDLERDDSLTKYVDPDISFEEKNYIPEPLVSVKGEYISDAKGYSTLREDTVKALHEMSEQFYQDRAEKMLVVSAYRSYSYQAGIKARGCPDNLCAKAGHSEHQSGLAVDFWSASTKEYWEQNTQLSDRYSWLKEHAHKYGFHQTYQNGREVDGYEVEPWHWRYLGVELASYLKEENITFGQFYKNIKEGM